MSIAFVAALTLLSFQLRADEPYTARPLHPTRVREYHVHHYKLTLNLDLDEKKCSGQAAITLSPLKDRLDSVRLDASEMNITNVSRKAGKSLVLLGFRAGDSVLAVALDQTYSVGDSLTLLIDYEISNPRKGMYFTAPDSGYPLKQRQVWTQGEPEDNHYWFPCYDFPNDFSSSELIATVKDRYMVIGNGILKGVNTDKKNHTKTFHWLEPKPHVSYLNSLVAGTYVEVKDRWKNVPISSFVYPHQRSIAPNSFGKTPKMIGFFEQKTGIPYPWEKFGQTVVQDFIFGGEENITAVTLNDNTIHDARAHLDNNSDGLVSHELAHQWWGDFLTCRDWSHAWLNEGFATYFENQFLEFDKGRDDAEHEIRGHQNGLGISDSRDHRRPTVCANYRAPIEVFDSRIYGKGACILAMLRHQLGDDVFWKSIRTYIGRHRMSNVETNDLKVAFEETSGKDLRQFFDQWVYKAGVPEFSVDWTWDSLAHVVTVDVAQTQDRDSLTGIFQTPVDIEIWCGGKPAQHTLQIDSLRQYFHFPAETKPDLVLFDKGSVVLKRVVSFRPTDEWLYQLQHADHGVDRLAAIEHLRLDADTERVRTALFNVMHNDPFWACRQSAAYAIASSDSTMRPNDLKGLLGATHDRDARVRIAAIGGLGKYKRNKAVLMRLTDLFREDSSYQVVGATLRALTEADSAHALSWCRKGLGRDSHRESIRAAALSKLVDIAGDSSYNEVIGFTDYGIDRELRVSTLQLASRTWKEKPEFVTLCIGFLHDPSYHMRRAAIDVLGSIKAAAALGPLQQIINAEKDGRLQQAARDAIKKIEG